MDSTFKLVKSALIHVFKNISIFKNQHNAIVEISGLEVGPAKNQSIRQKLMFICFSPLSSWVLFGAFLLMYLNPWRYVISFSRIGFLNNFVTEVLFSTDLRIIFITGFTLFLISFLFSCIFQIEFILLALLGFLVSNGDLHLRNALLFIPLVILSRLMLHLKLMLSLKSFWPFKQILFYKKNQLLNAETKKTWSIICALLFLAWLIATWLTLNSFQFLSNQGMFSSSMHSLRFEVFVASVFGYYFMEFFILSIWGHFYSLNYTLKIRP